MRQSQVTAATIERRLAPALQEVSFGIEHICVDGWQMPWLPGEEIRMFSLYADADGRMMAQYHPDFRRIYADRHGTVWSSMPAADR